jgi:Ca2+/H+ antiporter
MYQFVDYIRSTSLKNRVFFGLSIFCPIAFISKFIFPDNSTFIFCTSIFSMVPLAAFSTEVTENLANYFGAFFGKKIK